MTPRERYLACVTGEPVDRPPFWLFWGPWATTMERWKREGKPDHLNQRNLVPTEPPPATVPVNVGPLPSLAEEFISEDDDYIISRDLFGIVRRNYKHGESMPEFLDFPIKSRDDWETYKTERFDPHDPARLAGNWREQCQAWMEAGTPIQLGQFPTCSIYGGVRWLLGDEECLYMFYDDPELIHDMMGHLTDLFLTVFAEVVREVRVDVIHIWEDMCGKQGPLISPEHWREFMGPCYRRIKAFSVEHDIPVLSVDTDGKPDDIVDPMMETGVNYLWPMEVAAGTDVNDYRARWPELALMGGIDKRALAQGPDAIDAELDRIWPAVESGRYVPDLDHLIPDDVSWSNYKHYALALHERVMSMSAGT